MSINYDITKSELKKKKEKELAALDDKFVIGEIDNAAYILTKRKINQKYDYQ